MCAKKISRDYSISFPAIRGVQAGKEYYVTMCPLKLLPTMFQLAVADIPPALRAQRELNKGRVTPLTRYMLENLDNYVFSSIAASIDSEVEFDPYGTDIVGRKIGTLIVAMDAKTGNIVAMAGFDLADSKANPCMESNYPAASIFKIVTASAAIDSLGYTAHTPLYFNGNKYTLYKRQLNEVKNKYTTKK